MPRYIDVDLLMKELGITDPDCEKCGWGRKGFSYCTRDGDFVDACDAICEAPTADVRENVHAHWIHERLVSTGGGSYPVVRCSACQWQYPMSETNFCPNCGAEMGVDNAEIH